MVPLSIEMNGRSVIIVQVCTLRHLLLLLLLLLHLAYLLVTLALGLEPLLYGLGTGVALLCEDLKHAERRCRIVAVVCLQERTQRGVTRPRMCQGHAPAA